MTENEKFYDKVIAPALLAISALCEERGMSLVASVEYDKDERGSTFAVAEEAGLAIRMLHLCAMTAPNVDAYMINLARLLKQMGVSPDSSVAMTVMTRPT